jgi:antitoxin component YwqK of YwqJK toxin-antitoxin module
MGYYTRFSLEITQVAKAPEVKELTLAEVISQGESGAISQKEMVKKLKKIQSGETQQKMSSADVMESLREKNESARYAFDENGNTESELKWYDFHEEMIAFSKEYPNWLFTLSGEGEESGDIWKAYYVNGKYQQEKAKIVFDPFDMQKLK